MNRRCHTGPRERGVTPILHPGLSSVLIMIVICMIVVPGVEAQENGDGPLEITSPGLTILDHNQTLRGQYGIVINSSDVLFDGNGYLVNGGSRTGTIGVMVNGPLQNVTVRNLTVDACGIGVRFQSVDSGLIDQVTAVNCTENGIFLDNSEKIGIENCQALRNGYPGIAVNGSAGCRLIGSSALQNGDVGIYLLNATGTRIDHCTTSENKMNGIFLEESNRTTIAGCLAGWNRYPGIAVSGGEQNQITTNLLYGNQMSAVHLEGTGTALVLNNAARGSPVGLNIVNSTGRTVTGGNRWLTDQQEQVIGAGVVTLVPALGPSSYLMHALVALDRTVGTTIRTS